MKYSILFVVVLLLMVQDKLSSQAIRSYGVKVGRVTANQLWTYSGSLSNWKVFDGERNGFIGGGYVEWFEVPIISVITEAEYVQKGCSDEFIITSEVSPDPIGTKLISPRFDYISIPIFIKLRYDILSASIYCLGGPRFDILIGKNSDASGEVFDDVKSTDYGISYGGGIEFANIFMHQIGVEFRYSPSSQIIYSNNLLRVKNNSYDLVLNIGI